MKLVFLPILFLATACASCQFVKDQAEAPANLDQDRIPLSVLNQTEVGIHGTIDLSSTLYVRSYGGSTATVRGLGECGYITSGASKSIGWIPISLQNFPEKEFCLYSIQVRTNKFDAPSIGHFLVRRFLDPNVKPLKTLMNKVVRTGVNWVQIKQDGLNLTNGPGGIYESRDIKLLFNGTHSGKLNITGCGFSPNVTEYELKDSIDLTVDYLYRQAGKIEKSCVFMITANHNDALKESTSVFVKVYNGAGSFLDAPIANLDSWGQMCFSFVDPYVVGISVNGKWRKNATSKCVPKATSYVVEGVTSKGRVFYGEYDGNQWVEMQ